MLVERQSTALLGSIQDLQAEMQAAVGEDSSSVEELLGRLEEVVENDMVNSLTLSVSPQRRIVLEAVSSSKLRPPPAPDKKKKAEATREFRRVNSGGECGAPRGGGPKFTASGVLREAFQPGDLAFPQISAPARAPRPLFSPSGNTPEDLPGGGGQRRR